MTVLGNRLLCKPHKNEKTEGGVIKPHTADHASTFQVKFVGTDVTEISVGDIIHVSSKVSHPDRANKVTYGADDYFVFTLDNVIILE